MPSAELASRHGYQVLVRVGLVSYRLVHVVLAWIAAQVAPEMKRRGMLFVGLDVIGDYLTEVNVTSPTCVRELDAQFGLNIAGLLFDAIESRVAHG